MMTTESQNTGLHTHSLSPYKFLKSPFYFFKGCAILIKISPSIMQEIGKRLHEKQIYG